MKLAIPDNLLDPAAVSEADALLDLALGLFMDQRVTLGTAAQIARMSQGQFMQELGRRKIPMHYDVEDFQADLRTLEDL